MKNYIKTIKLTQRIFLGISIVLLATLPGILVLYPETVSYDWLYFLAHTSLFLVMIIRPIADLLPSTTYIRPLVILRKGVGVFSASIIVSFLLAKIILDSQGFFSGFFDSAYWSLQNLALLAHLADLSAILLLATSNNLSKRLLGTYWKKIQRLSYVYFYGSGLYVVFILQDYLVLLFMIVVTTLTVLAYRTNQQRRIVNT